MWVVKWQVRIERHDPREIGTRTLHGPSCAAVADATALVLTLMVDPFAVVEAPAPVVVIPQPESPSESPWAFGLLVAALGDYGTLVGAAPGFSVRGTLDENHRRYEVGLDVLPKNIAPAPGRSGAGGKLALYSATAAACLYLVDVPLNLGPCVGIDVGWIVAQGYGITTPGRGNAPLLAGRGGIVAAWTPIEHLSVILRADTVIPVDRPRFLLANVGQVYQTGAVAGRALLGAQWQF